MAGDEGDTGGTESKVPASLYDDELLSANWNPVIALLEWSCSRTFADATRSTQQQVREEDAEAFLGRVYTLGF
jgi:hypothetical protein